MSKRMVTIDLYPGKEIILGKDGGIRVYTVKELKKNFVVCSMEGKYDKTFTYRTLQDIKQGKNRDYEWIA